MIDFFKSYKCKRRKVKNAICQKMRDGKERKRLSMPPPDYPIVANRCISVTVKDCINGIETISEYLLDSDGGRIDQYILWDIATRQNMGIMGRNRAFKTISEVCPSMHSPY